MHTAGQTVLSAGSLFYIFRFFVSQKIKLSFESGLGFFFLLGSGFLRQDFTFHLPDDTVHCLISLPGLFCGPADNQRRAGFIDEQVIHFIDDGIDQRTLDAVRQIADHIVTEVIEAELVVRAVSNIGGISLFAGYRP